MDPVDKTFDTIYWWSQAVSRAAKNTGSYVSSQVSAVSESVSGFYRPVEEEIIVSEKWQSVGYRSSKLMISSVLALTLGVSGLLYFKKAIKKRRRAERLPNGARKDVILIVGSVVEPLTRFIAHDLETRGFIVYITSTNSKSDLKFFQNESVQDIKSFIISSDFKNNEFNTDQISKFDYLLSSEHIPFQGAKPNKLNLIGIIILPDFYFPSGKFHSIPPSTWDESIELNMLLPLNLFNNGLIGIAEKYDSNIIFITPTLSANLKLPYHSIENITSSFLSSLCENLSNDYDDLNITNLKLGSIKINSNNNKKTFGIKGESLKNLHHKIFDLLYNEHNSKIIYCGFGSRFLNYFGNLIPFWLINFLFR